jgi:hypothetical protein
VDLQVLSRTTDLAPPAVPAQYLISKLFVGLGIKPQSGLFGPSSVHEAFSVTSCRKACRCSPGGNLKNRDMDCRSTVGSSFSRLAPARKSAQIISRQYPRDLSVPSINAAVSIACSTTGIWVLYSLNRVPLELILRHRACLVQPGCTIEVLAVLGEVVKSGLRQAPFAAEPETV